MTRLRTLLLSLSVLCVAPAAHATATLRSVELAAQGDSARVTLRLSAAASRKVFSMAAPDRVVIDLQSTQPAAGLRLPAAAGPVLGLRRGVQPGRTLRLVLQLRGPVGVHSSWQGDARHGYRLTLDLGQSGASTASEALSRVAPQAQPASAPVVVARPAHAPSNSGRDIVVAIDAGHGGQDPGASGHGGTHEKDVVLAIARALARRVNAEPGMRAYLTRDTDRFIELRERINLAREAHADLFVSVHADSIANREVSGSSVYVLSERGATNEAARWLAERENAADLKGGVSLGDKSAPLASVLIDLSQSASIGSSMEAAQRVLSELDRVGDIRKSQVQQAGFVVLKSPDIPSMLVETAYISNPGEEQRLRTAAHQEEIANAIFSGLREYFRANPPDGSLFAQQRRGAGELAAVSPL